MHSLLARAKVNLCLHVGGRRGDGLHDLFTLAVFPALGDTVSAAPADDLSLVIDGPFASALGGLAPADNLVLRAARALRAETGTPPGPDKGQGARLTLTKRLPPASGIGGGTADAVAALILLRDLWRADISDARLMALAFRLGADGPLCLMPYLSGAASAVARGAGERVAPGPRFPPLWICLVNPGRAVATGAVFAGLAPRAAGEAVPAPALPPGLAGYDGLERLMARTGNDLETPARALCPAIGTVLEMLAARPGCLAARMSGSGATCFGLFASRMAADGAARQATGRGWWSAAARAAFPGKESTGNDSMMRSSG